MRGSALVLFICLLTTGEARSEPQWLFSGQSCQATDENDANERMDSHGATNVSTTVRVQAWCPFFTFNYSEASKTIGTTSIYVEDNATATGTNYQFDCAVKYRTSTGTVYSSSVLSSSDGFNTLTWSQPFGSGSLAETGSFTAYCYVPVAYLGSNSRILGGGANWL